MTFQSFLDMPEAFQRLVTWLVFCFLIHWLESLTGHSRVLPFASVSNRYVKTILIKMRSLSRFISMQTNWCSYEIFQLHEGSFRNRSTTWHGNALLTSIPTRWFKQVSYLLKLMTRYVLLINLWVVALLLLQRESSIRSVKNFEVKTQENRILSRVTSCIKS